MTTEPEPQNLRVADGVYRLRIPQGRGLVNIRAERGQTGANSLILEINGARTFELGNECDTGPFRFKCVQPPRLPGNAGIVDLPGTLQGDRPVDEALVQELAPLVDLLQTGEYLIFETSFQLSGPYDSENKRSYFFQSELRELWGIQDPKQQGLRSGWEHYEGWFPHVVQSGKPGLLEKHYNFVIPLRPRAELNEEAITLCEDEIRYGLKPRALMLGLYQRGVPNQVKNGTGKVLHSFLAGFLLDGHHKLAAYRRLRVPARFLVVLAPQASTYHPLKEEGPADGGQSLFEQRLTALRSPGPAFQPTAGGQGSPPGTKPTGTAPETILRGRQLESSFLGESWDADLHESPEKWCRGFSRAGILWLTEELNAGMGKYYLLKAVRAELKNLWEYEVAAETLQTLSGAFEVIDRIADLERSAESSYEAMYRGGSEGRESYSSLKDFFSEAIHLAEEAGFPVIAERLSARLGHITAIYRSQFS